MRDIFDYIGIGSFVTMLSLVALVALEACGTVGSSTTTTYSVTQLQLDKAREALGITKCVPEGSNYTALGVKFSPNGGTVTVTCNPLGALD